jgi:predicted RNA-binding Zn ribbon-like protein
LFSFERLVEFGRVTGVLGGDDAARLLELAGKRRAEADGAYGRATEARKRLFWMFAGEAAGERVSPDDLSWLAEIAKPYLRLERAEDACHWRASADGFDAVLAAVLSEAIALLTSTDLNAVRECGGDDCTWLFVDRSRNRSRRWCSMSDCGNVEKARRHYARKKAARH